MKKSESIGALSWALSKAQSEMESARKNKKNTRSKYADISSVIATLKEPLAKYDLSYAQFPLSDENNRIGVETIVSHKSGEWISGEYFLPQSKTLLSKETKEYGYTPQTAGIVISYARRYALLAVFGMSAEDDDALSVSQAIEATKKEKKSFAEKALYERKVKMMKAFGTIGIEPMTILESYGAVTIESITEENLNDAVSKFETISNDPTMKEILFKGVK
jgi:hypothetical protein